MISHFGIRHLKRKTISAKKIFKSPFTYAENCCWYKNTVGKSWLTCILTCLTPEILIYHPFFRLLFCILQSPKFRYQKCWQAQAGEEGGSCQHNLPPPAISDSSKELPHALHFEEPLPSPRTTVKQLLDYPKQTAEALGS